MSRKVVKLLRKSGMYAKDEVAGFPENIANQMIERGIAEAYNGGDEQKQTKRKRPSTGDTEEKEATGEDKQMRSRGGTNYETK